jgi:hypothetical protein
MTAAPRDGGAMPLSKTPKAGAAPGAMTRPLLSARVGAVVLSCPAHVMSTLLGFVHSQRSCVVGGAAVPRARTCCGVRLDVQLAHDRPGDA